MSPSIRVERRDTDEAMHAALGLEPAIGVGATDRDGGGFEPGFLTAALFEPFDLVTVRICPADIHPQQHLGPILRLCAAGAGMNFEIAVVAIGLARQQAFELALGRLGAQSLERQLRLGHYAEIALRLTQLDKLARLFDLAFDPPIAADRLVEPGALAEQSLRARRIVPQARILGLRVQLGEAPGRPLPVKDASSAAPATF